jgi:hypothetical protein
MGSKPANTQRCLARQQLRAIKHFELFCDTGTSQVAGFGKISSCKFKIQITGIAHKPARLFTGSSVALEF